MRHETANRLQTVLLSSHDVDEIVALYELGRAATPHGFLAARGAEDFRRIFSKPDEVIGTGIRDGRRLIAYSICHRIERIPFADNAVLADLDAGANVVYYGDGTVVHPDYQGRSLGQRISRLRWEQISERHIDHVLGLIDVANIVSIGNAVLAGVLLVGFARDETSLNYIGYAGSLRKTLRDDTAPVAIGWKDHERQRSLFAERKVVCNLARPAAGGDAGRPLNERQFVFRPIR